MDVDSLTDDGYLSSSPSIPTSPLSPSNIISKHSAKNQRDKQPYTSPYAQMIAQTTTSSFYYPYSTLHMQPLEVYLYLWYLFGKIYFRFFVHLVGMPFVQGVFQGIGEVFVRRWICGIWPMRNTVNSDPISSSNSYDQSNCNGTRTSNAGWKRFFGIY